MKIFTIGDSISQGFMSGASARTDLSYSTLLSKILNHKDYSIPTWPKDGMPINIETIFRILEKRLGNNIQGLYEWPVALNIINNYLDELEGYYERGDGWPLEFQGEFYHNVSIRGFDVSYSWLIKPELARKIIKNSPYSRDNRWGLTNESLLRTAVKVLESGSNSRIKNPSQLDWLNYHHQNDGVENLILWLGSNNALGTVIDLKIVQTSNNGTAFKNGPESIDYHTRINSGWNLWHPLDFKMEYQFLIDKIIDIMENNPKGINYKIFIGTIPLVTIVPLIKAVGGPSDREDVEVEEWPVDQNNPSPMNVSELLSSKKVHYSYSKYYAHFPFADKFDISDSHLNLNQIVHIDNTIRHYNKIIQEIIANANCRLGKRCFYLVDISDALSKMALKRNKYDPKYNFPEYFKFCYPKVDTRYYGTTRNGEMMAGGIFSLDGVHPSAIGQGLIAYEFLKVMKIAGSYIGDIENALNWHEIFENDSLYSQPIKLTSEIYDNISLKKWLFEMIRK